MESAKKPLYGETDMPLLTNEYLNYNPQLPNVLYHYCPTQAFLSIIENKNIWLSDANKTNDKTELVWLFTQIKNVIEQALESYKNIFNSEIISKAKVCADQAIDALLTGKAIYVQNSKNMMICFSEAENLLSQWRAYADNGNGLAIGFDSIYLKQFISSSAQGFTKVIYGEAEILSFLHKGIDTPLKYAIQSAVDENDDIGFFASIAMVILSLFQEGFVFKHESFSEEQEWRIFKKFSATNYSNSDGVDDYGYVEFLDGIFCKKGNYVGDFSRSEIKFRSTGNDIRTYMELGFDKIKDKIIKRIIIGPRCQMKELDLRLLLAKNGYIDEFLSNKIEIIKSAIPYQ